MSRGIVIIGSGFAARQLVKNIRKQDATVPLTLLPLTASMSTTSPISAMLSARHSVPTTSPASRRGSLPNSLICACSRTPG